MVEPFLKKFTLGNMRLPAYQFEKIIMGAMGLDGHLSITQQNIN